MATYNKYLPEKPVVLNKLFKKHHKFENLKKEILLDLYCKLKKYQTWDEIDKIDHDRFINSRSQDIANEALWKQILILIQRIEDIKKDDYIMKNTRDEGHKQQLLKKYQTSDWEADKKNMKREIYNEIAGQQYEEYLMKTDQRDGSGYKTMGEEAKENFLKAKLQEIEKEKGQFDSQKMKEMPIRIKYR